MAAAARAHAKHTRSHVRMKLARLKRPGEETKKIRNSGVEEKTEGLFARVEGWASGWRVARGDTRGDTEEKKYVQRRSATAFRW